METPPVPTAPEPPPTNPEPSSGHVRQTVNLPPDENLVGEARRKQQKAEHEAKELRDRLEELEDRDRSEVEKAIKRAEKAEQFAQELEQKSKSVERGGWLRDAAAAADFHDPSDAVTAADLDTIESERDAKKFVERLAEQKKHLVKPDEPTPHADKLGRVLNQGKAEDPQKVSAANSLIQEEHERAASLAEALKRVSDSNKL